MKNNRGFTIVEIIVSISLISLVMMFLFRLLLLVRTEDSLTHDKATVNVLTSLVISEIQDDFFTQEIKYIYKPTCINPINVTNRCCCSTGLTDCMKFYYKTGEIQELGIYQTDHFSDSIKYGDVSRTLPINYSFLSFGAYNMTTVNKFVVDEIGSGAYLSAPPVTNYNVDSLLLLRVPILRSNVESGYIEIRSTYSCQNIINEFGGTTCNFLRPSCPTSP